MQGGSAEHCAISLAKSIQLLGIHFAKIAFDGIVFLASAMKIIPP